MRRARRVKLNAILRQLRSENHNDVFDAASDISYRYDDAPTNPIIKILERSENPLNREYAAYSLISILLRLGSKISHKRKIGFYRDKYKNDFYRREIAKIIKAVIKTVQMDESPTVRAQALETIGSCWFAESENYPLRKRIEKCVVGALSDESHEVRFWACYAAGQLKMKTALGKLSEMVENDRSYLEFWWRVSEEAADAIEWINGRFTEARIPGGQFETINKENLIMAEQGKNNETTRDDVYNDSEKDTTATGRNLPNGDGTVSDEDVQAITGENDDRPTGQDHSTENYEKTMPTSGVGAVQNENDATSDVAHIKDEE